METAERGTVVFPEALLPADICPQTGGSMSHEPRRPDDQEKWLRLQFQLQLALILLDWYLSRGGPS